jgi:hypothetical protein
VTDLELCREVLTEAVATCELLVNMGFDPKDVHVHLGITSTPWAALLHERTGPNDVCLFVALSQGALTWRLCVGPIPSDGPAFEKELARLTSTFGLLGAGVRERALSSRVRAQRSEIEAGIMARGIAIPRA